MYSYIIRKRNISRINFIDIINNTLTKDFKLGNLFVVKLRVGI